MAIIARVRKARKQIRIRGGIPLIVSLLAFNHAGYTGSTYIKCGVYDIFRIV